MQDRDQRLTRAGERGGAATRRHQGRDAGLKRLPVQQGAWRKRHEDVVAGAIGLHDKSAAHLIQLCYEPRCLRQDAATCQQF